jgi:hypothetical protein
MYPRSREEPGADFVPRFAEHQDHMNHDGGRMNEVEGRQNKVQHRFLLKLSLNTHDVRYVSNVC